MLYCFSYLHKNGGLFNYSIISNNRKVNNKSLCNISCYLLNARGLKSKLLDFEHEIFVMKQLPGMIFIIETWLDNNCIISDFIYLNTFM